MSSNGQVRSRAVMLAPIHIRRPGGWTRYGSVVVVRSLCAGATHTPDSANRVCHAWLAADASDLEYQAWVSSVRVFLVPAINPVVSEQASPGH